MNSSMLAIIRNFFSVILLYIYSYKKMHLPLKQKQTNKYLLKVTSDTKGETKVLLM